MDRDREARIEDLVREGTETYDGEIRGSDSRELFYALSSLRQASLCWYPFEKDCRILEVGCGYGALTGLLCGCAAEVEAMDRDPACVRTTRKRYAGRKNLKVTEADVRSFEPENPYDYIVVLEFLEFYDGDEGELLARLKDWLAPGGRLLLGFRNRYGLKYQCGAIDEIVKRPGDAMDPAVPLHTKEQMETLLEEAGYTEARWFYPLPDYGFTQLICSDEWMPRDSIRDRLLTYDPFGNGSSALAKREWEAWDGAVRGGLTGTVANVLLAECRTDEAGDFEWPGRKKKGRIIGAVLSADREAAHAYATCFLDTDQVIKRPLYPEGKAGMQELYRNQRALLDAGLWTVPLQADAAFPGAFVMPWVRGELLIDCIRRHLQVEPAAVFELYDQLYADICRSSAPSDTCLPELDCGDNGPVLQKAYIDMIPNNAFRKAGGNLYFDQEFAVENCPAAYVMYRAVRYTWLHIAEAEKILPVAEMKKRYGLEEKWERYTRFEDAFTHRNRNRDLYAQVYRWAWGEKPYGTGLVMGTFDLFHMGHLNLLRRAKERCRYLRVGVLSDSLVELYKKIRPEISQEDRCGILRAVRYVDEVVLIEGEYVSKIAEWYKRPYDCFFSGDDYADNGYWRREAEELEKLGAKIEFFPYTEAISSSMIRSRLKEQGSTLRKEEREID